MTQDNLTPQQVWQGYLDYDAVRKPNEGSVAIHNGRMAGQAAVTGLDDVAQEYWKKLEALAESLPTKNAAQGMPSFKEFQDGYKANQGNFSEFASKENFPATAGRDFSNAAGSYAFALDYLKRGKESVVNGDNPEIWNWAAKAVRAAGFEETAKTLDVLDKARKGPDPETAVPFLIEELNQGHAIAKTQWTDKSGASAESQAVKR